MWESKKYKNILKDREREKRREERRKQGKIRKEVKEYLKLMGDNPALYANEQEVVRAYGISIDTIIKEYNIYTNKKKYNYNYKNEEYELLSEEIYI